MDYVWPVLPGAPVPVRLARKLMPSWSQVIAQPPAVEVTAVSGNASHEAALPATAVACTNHSCLYKSQ
ncbi:MAG: hypothetical protein JXC32_15185, partial [Anaerolineae bacterium]|nr:hypothetical protein [Anaerolineae bacterium]